MKLNYTVSTIIPIINEIISLKKTLLIINKITFLIKNEIVWKNMIYVLLELDPQVMRQQ